MLLRSVKFNPVAVLLGGIAFVPAVPSVAQDQGVSEVEEVVVSGYRESLEAALSQKRDSVNAVDSILAEDIADFPDLNLAESLQRIPGVAISRSAGEGRQVTVRGLGPQFTRVRINGMEGLATGGGTDATGGTNRGRNFDFNNFASELFKNLTVRKTTSAESEEGSLGATVDLRTARPFDFDDFTFSAGAQLGYNDLSEDTDPRITLLLSNQFADGKFGALFSIAYSERNLLDTGASTVRWQRGSTNFQSQATSYTDAEINNAYRPRIPRYDTYIHEQERTGVTGSLQFMPSENTVWSLDVLYSKFDATRQEIFLEAPVFSGSGNGQVDVLDAELRPAGVDQNGVPLNTLVYGVFDDVDIRSENRFDDLTTEFTQLTLSVEHDLSDRLRLKGLVGSSESNHDNPIQTTLLFDANDIDGYSFDYRRNPRLPVLSYGSVDVTSPATWSLSQIRLRPQTANNKFDIVDVALEFDLNDALTLKAGVNKKAYDFVSTEMRRDPLTSDCSGAGASGISSAISNAEGCLSVAQQAAAISSFSQLISISDGLDIPTGTATTFLIPDISAAAGLFDLYNTAVFPLSATPSTGNNYGVKEDDFGLYVQLDFDVPFDAVPIRGNVGIRSVDTDQHTSGATVALDGGGNPVLAFVENDRSYSDSLPSLNLVAEIHEDLLVRFGWAKVMTRPNLGQITPGTSFSVSGSSRTVTVGNPDLDPFRADSTDVSIEWYFADESLLSLALFKKEINTFIQTLRETGPFTGNRYGFPDSVALAACGSTSNCDQFANWNFQQSINTPGGDLDGFEFSYQQPFSFLPGIWSNFGAIFNYTSVDSDIQYVNSQGVVVTTNTLTGLSKSSYNATLYYEGEVFSGRISVAYRDDYLTTVPGRNGVSINNVQAPGNNDIEGTHATTNWDMSLSWALGENVKLTIEGLNLTDEFDDQYIDSSADRLSYYHHTGRQYLFGVRYTY